MTCFRCDCFHLGECILLTMSSPESVPILDAQRAKQLKSRIAKLSSDWRKRKRLANEFIMNMEEATDGTISVSHLCFARA